METFAVSEALDVPACAARLGVSEAYIRKLVNRRAIPFHKIGSRVLFKADDIAAFFEAGRVEAVAQ